jgi:hypothetical protein
LGRALSRTLRGEAEAASSSGRAAAGEVNYERVGEGVSIWTARDGRVFTSQAEYVAYERSLFRQSRTLALPAAEEGAEGVASATLRGSQQGAAQLQDRATELNAMRRVWEANNGTTAAIKVQHKVTGEIKILIATEGKVMPKEFIGKLRPSEEFIGEVGHAEQTILQNLGPDWIAIEGGTSHNVCKGVCQPLVEGSGMKLGGPHFKGASDKTPFRMFWRE